MFFRRFWAARRGWEKLLCLVGLSALLAVGAEVWCNAPALGGAGLVPEGYSASDCTVETDADYTEQENGIQLEKAGGRVIDLVLKPGTELHSAQVSLTGEGVVNVFFLILDEASSVTPVQMYSGYCVAQDEALRTLTAPFESSGDAMELRVRLKPMGDQPFTVESVTLNAPIPFRWLPWRVAGVFAGALLLLCALLLPAWRVEYAPKRVSHRLAVALPLVALMGFATLLAGWIAPQTPLFSGLTDTEAAQSTNDPYAALFAALQKGRLDLEITPDPALLALNNPYDQGARVSEGVRFPFDYALYQGKFYTYYGLAPILTLYAPYRLLTGTVPISRDATLIMAWLTIAMIGYAVRGLQKRFAPQAGVAALSLACVTAVFASGAMFLLASADFYYLAQLSFVGWCAGAVGFGLHALARPKGAKRAAGFALSGVCFALCVMSRPGATPLVAAFLLPLYWGQLRRGPCGGRDAAAFLVPVALGLGVVFWYNAARFGSPLDFGLSYQMTVTDARWARIRLTELPKALYHYLLEMPVWNNRFPYLSAGFHALPTPGRYVFTLSSIGVLTLPVNWALGLSRVSGARALGGEPALRRERAWLLALTLLASLAVMVVSFGIGGTTLRYTCDFRLAYVLLALLCALPLMSGADTPERRALAGLCVALCVLTVFMETMLLFDNERDYILKNSPQIYYGIQRALFPY